MFSINVSRVEWYERVKKIILPDIRKVHKNGNYIKNFCEKLREFYILAENVLNRKRP